MITTDRDICFDQYGAPVFHEIDGIRYWGREGEAETYGLPLQVMDWTDEKIAQARRTAYQRQARAEALNKAADDVKKEAQSERPLDYDR